jgi:outer membrane protein assembly factor BamB/tetratricopeptide (TPR) repeat protein
MALRGDLASVDLAQVFQMLALNQKVGLLYIQSPTSWKALYFNQNGVTLYFNEHTMLDRVLSKLVRGGQISANGVLEAREHAAHQGHQVIDSLLAGGYLTEEDLDNSVRTEIEEEIYELFFWGDAKFDFYEGATEHAGRDGVIHDQFFFGTDAIIMEAARRIDEWAHIQTIVPTGCEVFRVAAKDSRAFDLHDDLFQVFELIDGMRNVDRVIEITGLPSFHIYKMLSTLLEDQVIEPLPLPMLLSTGRECMVEGRTQDAINLFERAVEMRVGLPGVHSQAAEAYRSTGEFERSCFHTKCVAEHHAANGNLRKAIVLFRLVLETIPTDLEAYQRAIELSIDHPELATDDFDPLNVGKDLVDLFLEMGEIDRVRSLLEELIREHPSDIELKKSLINVHTKVGDTKRVIELYESIAEDLTRSGDPIQAIKYLQKILQMDRARTDISEWIKRLYQVDERQRTRRRSMVALGMVFALLVVASIGYYLYNRTARRELEGLKVSAMIEQKDFSGIKVQLIQLIESFPFTMAAEDARGELKRVVAIGAAAGRVRDVKLREEQKRLEKIRFDYRFRWQQQETHFEHNELEKALRDIEEVRKLVVEAGQSRDEQWSAEKNVDRSYMELLTYLTTAKRLEKEAREAQDRGDWKTQRKLVLNLIKDFQLASVARRVQIPVMFVTRPEGAMIYYEGKPLTRLNKRGQAEPLRTPTVVLCPGGSPPKYSIQKAGFEKFLTTVNPIRTEGLHAVLSMLPMSTLKFGAAALGQPGVSRNGKVVVGLRDGKLGISTNGVDRTRIIKLPGLSEIAGAPCVTSSRIYFATNEGQLVCHDIADGRRLWNIKLSSPLVFDPVLANNRIYLVDRDGRILCLSADQRGKELWRQQLKGMAAGKPVVFGRSVGVGSQLGTVFVLDALKGKITTKVQLKVGVTTDVQINKSLVVFGTEDGRLHGYRRGIGGRRLSWVIDVGRAIREGELVMAEDYESVYLVGNDKLLQRVSLLRGRVLSSRKMVDRPRPGMLAMLGRLFVVTQVIQRAKNSKVKQWDVLLALDPDTLEIEWRFSDGGVSRGRLARGSKRLYVTGSSGEVYRLK